MLLDESLETLQLEASDADGQTALARAAFGGHVEVIQLLLQHRASTIAANKFGETPLHLAAARGPAEVIEQIVHAAGPRAVSMRDHHGATSLHVAARAGHLPVLTSLLHNLPDERDDVAEVVGQLDRRGLTAADVAAGAGHVVALSVLEEVNATLSLSLHT